jgi:hypothetical protein
MGFVRGSYVLMILAAGLAAALCFGGMSSLVSLMDASTIASVVAVAATSAVAMLATTVGALMVSDWQADMQSRQEWAQLGLTPVHISRPLGLACESDVDPRYLDPASDETLRRVLQVYRAAAQTTYIVPDRERSAGLPPAKAVPGPISGAGAVSTADAPERAPSDAAGARLAATKTISWKGRSRAKVLAARVRLVANGHAWPAPIPPRVDKAADIIVLSGRQRERAPPLPESSVVSNGAESTAQPTYRGPPRSRVRRSAAPPDPIVCDNFGPRPPIGRAELDVIETYLERELRELLGYTKRAGDREKA